MRQFKIYLMLALENKRFMLCLYLVFYTCIGISNVIINNPTKITIINEIDHYVGIVGFSLSIAVMVALKPIYYMSMMQTDYLGFLINCFTYYGLGRFITWCWIKFK